MSRSLALVPTGRRTRLYDCGPAGRLTAKQAAERAGVTVSTVLRRRRMGVKGEALVAGRCAFNGGGSKDQYRERLHAPPSANASAVLALQLARDFPDRMPTVDHLRRHYGMSRATAYRWIAAWREVFGREAARA